MGPPCTLHVDPLYKAPAARLTANAQDFTAHARRLLMTTILAPPLLHSALALLSALIGLMFSATIYKAAPRAQQQQQQPEASSNAPQVPPKRKLAALYPFASARRPRPIPNSYWATPNLLACEYPWCPSSPHKPKLDALLRAGVRTFIDLTEPGELLPYNTVLLERAALLAIAPTEIRVPPVRDPRPRAARGPGAAPRRPRRAARQHGARADRRRALPRRHWTDGDRCRVLARRVRCGARRLRGARDDRARVGGRREVHALPAQPRDGRAGRLCRKLPRAAAAAACAACVRDCVAAAAASAAVVVVGVAAECSTAVVAGGPSAGLAPGACLAPSHPPAGS